MKFKYFADDASSKPPVVPLNSKKLTGQAAENWSIVRLFPLLIDGLILNTKDKIWKLYLTLKEIVELVCSYRLSHSQIFYLDVLCKCYVDRRKKHFPSIDLRPKHHYLLHYGELIIKFGPLIHLWTMRLESKHSYFKQCGRRIKNFKNVSGTLTEKHQLYMAYRCTASYARTVVSFTSPQPVNIALYSATVVSVLGNIHLAPDAITCSSAEWHGITYKCRMIVITHIPFGFKFCRIQEIIYSRNVLYFLVNECGHQFLSDKGLYRLTVKEDMFKCLILSDLINFYPLPCYEVQGHLLISLKQSVSLA